MRVRVNTNAGSNLKICDFVYCQKKTEDKKVSTSFIPDLNLQ